MHDFCAPSIWLEEFNWHWYMATPPLEPQAPGRIEEKNGCWLDEIEWKSGTCKVHLYDLIFI